MSLNIYLEQQYVEDLEDKYAELKRQHELLKKENELLKKECELSKTGNYNLKRDNDILRGDIYNLRLENSKLTTDLANLLESSNADKDELKGKIIILEQEYEALKIQLENERPKTNLLPKVAEKETYRQFMLNCSIPIDIDLSSMKTDERQKYCDNSRLSVEEIINDDSEYIVCNSWIGNIATCTSGLLEFILTNKGKMFFKARNIGYNHNHYGSYYADFKVSEMNLQLVDGILRKFLMSNTNGYMNYEISSSLSSKLPIVSYGKRVW